VRQLTVGEGLIVTVLLSMAMWFIGWALVTYPVAYLLSAS
jgi:hypothetical protein